MLSFFIAFIIAVLLYILYSYVILPLYVLRYYAKQEAHTEYFPLIGTYGKGILDVRKTGDVLIAFKKGHHRTT